MIKKHPVAHLASLGDFGEPIRSSPDELRLALITGGAMQPNKP